MKKVFLMALLLATMIFMYGGRNEAQAKIVTKYGYTYDDEVYQAKWTEEKRLDVYQTEDISVSSKESIVKVILKKGTYLGCVYSRAAMLTSIERIDDTLYQSVLITTQVYPNMLTNSISGMTQRLKVEANHVTVNMESVKIYPETQVGSTSYTVGGSFGVGFEKSNSISVGEDLGFTLSQGGSLTAGISASTTFTKSSLLIITNGRTSGDKGYDKAVWDYDYVSSSSSKAQNAYLFGQSTQNGSLGEIGVLAMTKFLDLFVTSLK